ncbi:MAG TPA: four helix bundle protein [Flavisolibacter sp.]|nr:four helix bundle protein [Flavisolibacter sp.]
MQHFKQTKVYEKAFVLAMDIFEVSKNFPVEERYSLTDQIHRSSRSVCSNLAEAYRKKKYPAHFLSKVSDADMENSETLVWLDFALGCKYLSQPLHGDLLAKNKEIGRLLGHMANHPELY